MQLPLTLQLKPSRLFLIVLTSGHALAGVAVLLLPLPWIVRGAIVMLLGLLLLRTWHQASRMVQALVLRANGKLGVLRQDGQQLDVAVASATVVLPWLVIVHTDGAVPAMVIFSDGLVGADAHRQLRVWLKGCAEINSAAAK